MLTLSTIRHHTLPYTTLFRSPGLFPERLRSGALVKADVQLRHTAARRWGAAEDWAHLPDQTSTRALLLLHGLEGSSKSHYAQAIAQYFRARGWRSEEHTSELQSRGHLVCRLLLEEKNPTGIVGRKAANQAKYLILHV